MVLRRLFVPQAGTEKAHCKTIFTGFAVDLSTSNVMVSQSSESTQLMFPILTGHSLFLKG
jgi:hypothetical protein